MRLERFLTADNTRCYTYAVAKGGVNTLLFFAVLIAGESTSAATFPTLNLPPVMADIAH